MINRSKPIRIPLARQQETCRQGKPAAALPIRRDYPGTFLTLTLSVSPFLSEPTTLVRPGGLRTENMSTFRILWRRISDRKMERIATSNQILRPDVTRFSFLGLAPDGSPLVALTHSNSDIYALDVDFP